MRTHIGDWVVGLAATILLGGCASIPRDSGFADVQRTILDRTGHRIQWNQGDAADAQVADSIHALLQGELTADTAVQVALLNKQGLQAMYEELGIAQAELVEAGLLRNPTLRAEVRFPRYNALPFDIDISQSFIDLLLTPLRKQAAGAAFEAVKLRVTQEVLNTAAMVSAAFYRVQGAEQLTEMRRNIVKATDASLDAAQRLHDAGNASDLALANERALHEQTKIDLARAEREVLDAREELNALMGVWSADIDWTISPRLPPLPRVEIEAAHLESLAVSQRADVATARKEVEVVAATLGLTRSTALTSEFGVGAHLARETDGATSTGPTLSLPLPLFNHGQPAVAAAQARLRQAQRRYAAIAVQVRAEVRRARNNLLAARDLADYYSRVIVPLRHQIVQQNQLQFNAMQIGVFELLQSKQAEIDAGREYVEGMKNYWVARSELQRAVGGRLPSSTAPAAQQSTATLRPAGVPVSPAAPAEPHHHGD